MLGSEVLNEGAFLALKNKLKKYEQQKKGKSKLKEAESYISDVNPMLQGLRMFGLIESDGFYVLYDLFDNSPVLVLALLDSCLALDPCHHEWVNGTEYNRVFVYPVIKRVKKQIPV